ncbi:MAG: threonine/serine dehydratase [Pseudomonadota bacterium]|nr:threonine/serine dehydratase [Pseudomonadota bacterium]
MKLPVFKDILAAAGRIAPHAVRTPLLESKALNDVVGGRVLVKPECLQRVGAFKFRGAYNMISQLSREQWPGGVTTCSSGNHAQGVAEAARLCRMSAVVVMPSDAPELKVARTRRSGAEVVSYDRDTEDREAIAGAIASKRKAQFVPPYDHPDIIAGQGTAGIEIMEQAEEIGVRPDVVLAPCGGGGLISGLGLAAKHIHPGIEVIAVEPEDFDDTRRSLASGKRERCERASGSICDALLSAQPGELTFALNREQLSGAVTVSDEQAREAIRFAFKEFKLVVEPGGAVALAALLSGAFRPEGRTTAIVLSGGNIDPRHFAEILGGER